MLGFGSYGFWHGFTCATAIIGTIIGSIIVGKQADRYGRRKTLFIIAVMYFVSAVGSGLAWSWMSFSLFRLLGGLAVGGAPVVAPMYIAEISPANKRGSVCRNHAVQCDLRHSDGLCFKLHRRRP